MLGKQNGFIIVHFTYLQDLYTVPCIRFRKTMNESFNANCYATKWIPMSISNQ